MGPDGSRRLRLPGVSDNRHMKVTYTPAAFTPSGDPWYSLLSQVEYKICRESQNTLFISIFPPENLACYEITCVNVVEPERPQMTI
jgi:hypothetical protein